ncbi:Breast cancer type 1 susceptibility protein-like protein, partial [Bienertia sinuspersici]
GNSNNKLEYLRSLESSMRLFRDDPASEPIESTTITRMKDTKLAAVKEINQSKMINTSIV